MTILSCIKCDKKLESATLQVKGFERNQPYAGTTFMTYGHYGSTVFDCDGGYLEINICDPCLVAAAENLKVLHCTEKRPVLRPEIETEFWQP